MEKKDEEWTQNIKMKNIGREEEIKADDIFNSRKEAEEWTLSCAQFRRNIKVRDWQAHTTCHNTTPAINCRFTATIWYFAVISTI